MTANFVEVGGERFRVEPAGAWMTFSLEHERVHLGEVFHVSTYNASLANGGTALLTFKANSRYPHMLWNVAVGADVAFRIVENGTVSGSAAVTAYNRNRANSGTPYTTVFSGGTLTGGTALFQRFVPGGSGGITPGGGGRADVEWIGATERSYTLEVVNGSGNSTQVSIDVDWYEAPDGS